jgi:hypothetical protein
VCKMRHKKYKKHCHCPLAFSLPGDPFQLDDSASAPNVDGPAPLRISETRKERTRNL